MNKAFFKKDLFGKDIVKNKKDIKNLCEKCNLYKNCITPKMKPTGKGKKKILIIGEAPGRVEDKKGIQFIGQSGQVLRRSLNEINIDLDVDCWKTNTIICRPQNNIKPTMAQINYCKDNLVKTINELKPEKIITFGKIALQSLIGKKISVTSINKWIGWQIPDQDYKCWIFPNYCLTDILKNQNDLILKKLFDKYLKEAFNFNIDFPKLNDLEKKIETESDIEKVKRFLLSIKKGDALVFDFETTGKKPNYNKHKIICMSICLQGKTISFPMFENIEFRKELQRILEDANIFKIAHNLKFEHIWSMVILNIKVRGWVWDTMIASHVLNNKSGICRLKFQTYVNFGVVGYENEIKKYIDEVSKSDNSLNRLEECPLDKLLLYCGLDSFFTWKLYKLQNSTMSSFLMQGMDLLLQGIRALSDVQSNGMCFDYEGFLIRKKALEEDLAKLDFKIQNSEEVGKLKLEKDTKFNFNSTKQLRNLLYKVLKWRVAKETNTGLKSTDKGVLESYNCSLTNNILKHRFIKKIKDTYLERFNREAIALKNGERKIYPDFNLHTVPTYRSSSSFQNIPKRDEYANEVVRGVLIPGKDRQLLEVDYCGIEVRISACYHQDPVMIEYINNPESDMHRDIAAEIFKLEQGEVTKELRHIAKNCFVFPEFYGSYYVQCADAIWNNKLIRADKRLLKSKGIKNYQDFEDHVRLVEDRFWNKRFIVYSEWKDKIYKRYLKTGYVKLKTGFWCIGHMNKKSVTNYPIQGSAFHCLLKGLIDINSFMAENKFGSKIIGEVHDSIVFDVFPDELAELKKVIRYYMVEKIRDDWKWVIVPLDISANISEVNGSWAKMEDIEI